MEKWITRFVATVVAIGGMGLCWTFSMFSSVPIRQGRLLELSNLEMQLMGGSALAALAVNWCAIHLFSLSEKEDNPRLYSGLRIAMVLAAVVAMYSGAQWSLARVVAG